MKVSNEETLQYTLKELRARHNFSQQELANKLGVSRQHYNNMENNPLKVSCERMMEIADILDVTLGEIKLE